MRLIGYIGASLQCNKAVCLSGIYRLYIQIRIFYHTPYPLGDIQDHCAFRGFATRARSPYILASMSRIKHQDKRLCIICSHHTYGAQY